MKKLILSTVVIAALGVGVNTSTYAALASNAYLAFNSGVVTTNSYSTSSVTSGSYFGIDTNADGVVSSYERTAISQGEGLILGEIQIASGSHVGVPDGSELYSIDNPWLFFGNTGMHGSSSPTSVTATGVNTADIDFSGWFVTWNGITIGLGGGTQNCGTASDGICQTGSEDVAGILDNGTGLASVICAVDCIGGDTYTLDYDARVPLNDPSNFGGIFYTLHLEGTIPEIPIPAAVWLFGSGLLGLFGVSCRKVKHNGIDHLKEERG